MRSLPLLFVLAFAGSIGHARSTASAWRHFHPAWRESTLFLDESRSALPGDAEERLSLVLRDPADRLGPFFRVPRYLQGRVLFWMSVYARHPGNVRIVHDRDEPEIVYGYIDLPTGLSADERQELEARVLGELQRLLRLAHDPFVPGALPESDRTELRRLTAPLHADVPRRLGERLRTQTGQRESFQRALERGRALLALYEVLFRQNGIPPGLARIPFVESSFEPAARSRLGACGVWQFTPVAARDVLPARERRRLCADAILQGEAAALLLKRYRRALPDWGSAVTAYNSGVGTVRKLARRSRARSLQDVMELDDSHRLLGFAGRNYFAEFLAASLVDAYRTQIFFPGLVERAPPAPPPAPARRPVLAGLVPMP